MAGMGSERNLFKTGKMDYIYGIGRDITSHKLLEEDLQLIKKRYQKGEIIGSVGNWEFDIETGHIWGSPGANSSCNAFFIRYQHYLQMA